MLPLVLEEAVQGFMVLDISAVQCKGAGMVSYLINETVVQGENMNKCGDFLLISGILTGIKLVMNRNQWAGIALHLAANLTPPLFDLRRKVRTSGVNMFDRTNQGEDLGGWAELDVVFGACDLLRLPQKAIHVLFKGERVIRAKNDKIVSAAQVDSRLECCIKVRQLHLELATNVSLF
ncbi:hypothetical protein JB92DRAFT_2832619 [Gautieria morchelliformis]|nr:hypothetical protein JB92DRAFT_2832619 [Gautieria morchelliformis]